MQLYITFKSSSTAQEEASAASIEACISEIRSWMIQNKLMLNADKTELLFIISPKLRHKLTIDTLTIGDSIIQASTEARNLGVIFDRHLNMEAHVNALCQSCHGHLRRIGHIRKYLTTKAAEQLVHSFVT